MDKRWQPHPSVAQAARYWMTDRPKQTQVPSASEPADWRADERRQAASVRRDGEVRASRGHPGTRADGETVAARAERFRRGAPFLVERATLYDPHPLDPLPVVEIKTLPRPRSLLPAAVTLLGVVVVVGVAAGVLSVRNADGPRSDDRARHIKPAADGVAARDAPSAQPPGGAVTYDLTRRPSDAITGAWRVTKEIEVRRGEVRPAAPAPVAEATPAVPPADRVKPEPEAPRRALPRRLAVPQSTPPERVLAEPQMPARAPLDEPHVPRKTVETEVAPPRKDDRDPPVALHRAEPGPPERPGPNVVARVGRATEPPEAEEGEPKRRSAPARSAEGQGRRGIKSGAMSRRELRERMRRMRKTSRDALDVDRFELRGAGEIPKGFVYSGPQGQRP